MANLVLHYVPDETYRQLKRNAQQPAAPAKPSPDEVKDWLRREVWSLPVLDERSSDEILGH